MRGEEERGAYHIRTVCTRYTRCSFDGGTISRARQTGAGEHRLGATLTAGGAATEPPPAG